MEKPTITEIDFWRLRKLSEYGTVKVEFLAGENGLMPYIASGNLNLQVQKMHKGKIIFSFTVGGPSRTWHLKSPLQEGERATLVFRWRRFPLTREVLLVAKESIAFTLASDVRTPWEKKKLRGPVVFRELNKVKILSATILNDSFPASSATCGITVPPIDEAAWRQANE